MKRTIPTAIAIAVTLSGQAFAADLIETPEPPVVYDSCGAARFGGLYVGANVGANAYNAKREDYDGFLTDNTGWTSGDIHATGGVQVGYDWQHCNAVFGIVGDWNWTGAETTLLDNPNVVIDNSIASQMNWFATLRGRAGLAVDNSLFYVTGGLVWADIDTTLHDAPDTFSADHLRWGVVGGAGAEFLLGGNWSLGGEVLYMQFAEERQTFTGAGPTNFQFGFSDSALVARLALNYRFGGDGGYVAASTNGAYGGAYGSGGPFSGFYAGGNVGALGYSAFRDDNDGFLTDNSGWTNTDIHATGGVQIGYDWQSGHAVAGIVADWNWTGAEALLLNNPNGGDDDFIASQMNWFATARGRAGVAAGNALVYVTGGVVWADIDTTIHDGPITFDADNHSRWGLVGGVGTEFLIAGNWSVGAEVLYLRFAEDSQTFSNGGTLFQFDLDDSAIVARLALNYRFGGAGGYSDAGYDAGPARYNGFYAGLTTGGIGYAAARNDNDGYLVDNSGWTEVDIHGIVGGEIGYDWQSGYMVAGLVGDFTWASAYGDTPNNPNGGSSGGIASQMDWFATLRGRAGLAVDKTLVYVTGGVALARIDTTITDNATDRFNNDETRWGLVGGAGMEQAFGNGWSLGGEVLYMQFAETSDTFNNGTVYQFDYNDSAVVGKVKLSYRFGG